MDSLYNIEQELLDVIATLEDNGGEFTPELEERLIIGQDNLREKLTSYVAVINKMTAQIDACKCEEKRVSSLRKSRENTLDRIKESVLNAVRLFGDATKNGNYVIDLDTCRLSTRSSSSVNIDEERVNDYIKCITIFISENDANNCNELEYTDTDMINYINMIYKSMCVEKGIDYVPFTITDLYNISINVSYNSPNFIELYSVKNLIKSIASKPNFTINPVVSKTNMKQCATACDSEGHHLSTVASINNKDNLQIK